ncbi:hypothetical protein PhCBS80983_g04690 [Powellomyces hirtus]|uniref:Cytochrome P450 n=1 Tax=Powellomyces hirtus TaxID=109895 RepID=A0A507DXZ1_9FUNG|nr:hypothetical protein PhCBS80983_g04690 [Powellomyces hirtus]
MAILEAIPWGNPQFTAAFVIFSSVVAYRLTRPRSTLPTPKESLPIIGSTYAYVGSVRRKNFYKYLMEQQDLLGPMWSLDVLGASLYVMSDPKEARRLLTDTENFYRDEAFQTACKGITQYSLFLLPSGPQWKHHRKLIQPAFAPNNIRKVVPASIKHTDKLMAILADMLAKNPRAEADLHDCFQRLTLDIIGEVALGGHQFQSVDALIPEKAPKENMFHAFEQLIQMVGDRFSLPEWTWGFINSTLKDSAAPSKMLHDLADNIRQKRQAELDAETAAGIVRDKKDYDVLDRILIPNAEGELLSDENIVDEIIGFILAGHETSSNTVTALFMHLMNYPQTMQKLIDEIDSVLGPHGEPTMDSLKDLKYLDNVFKESIRLKSPVNAMARTTLHETVICGHHIPAKAPVLIHIAHLQQDPMYWGSDAKDFIPERWNDKQKMMELESIGAYMPFGAGGMMCVGFKLAITEIKIIVIRFLQQYKPALRPGQDHSWTVDGLTSGYRQGVFATFTPRA